MRRSPRGKGGGKVGGVLGSLLPWPVKCEAIPSGLVRRFLLRVPASLREKFSKRKVEGPDPNVEGGANSWFSNLPAVPASLREKFSPRHSSLVTRQHGYRQPAGDGPNSIMPYPGSVPWFAPPHHAPLTAPPCTNSNPFQRICSSV